MQIDEFVGNTGVDKLNMLCDPKAAGDEVRTGPSSSKGPTHAVLGANLQVVITSNLTKAELHTVYANQDFAAEQVQAFFDRCVLLDLYSLGVETRPEQDRFDLDAGRLCATIASMAAKADVPFPRQPVPPSAAFLKGWEEPRAITAPRAKRPRFSCPGALRYGPDKAARVEANTGEDEDAAGVEEDGYGPTP